MLLRQIVERLDEELGRLRRLREIVAELEPRATFSIAGAAVDEPTPIEAKSDAVTEPRVRRIVSREPRAERRVKVAEKPQTALTSAIPAGPVVVSAATVAKENAAKKLAQKIVPKVEEGTLGAMIRALRQQGAV